MLFNYFFSIWEWWRVINWVVYGNCRVKYGCNVKFRRANGWGKFVFVNRDNWLLKKKLNYWSRLKFGNVKEKKVKLVKNSRVKRIRKGIS